MSGAVTLVLGRDGMGEASEQDYGDWVQYVADHIEESCGFAVEVKDKGARHAQNDEVSGGTDLEQEMVVSAVMDMWDLWCGSDLE